MSEATIHPRKQGFRLDELVADPKRFQRRNLMAAGADQYGRAKGRSQAHIREMVQWMATNDRPLDPLLVWWDESHGRWYVVDGFHRHGAYRRAMQRRLWRRNRKVPCRVVEGAETDVIHAVYRDNAKRKVGFDQTQRLQFAWEALWRGELDDLSTREAAERCEVSRSTISNMRKKAQEVYHHHDGPEPPCLWHKAEDAEEDDRPDTEDEMRNAARDASSRLLEVFEDHGWNVAVLRMAMEMATEDQEELAATVWSLSEERARRAGEPDF